MRAHFQDLAALGQTRTPWGDRLVRGSIVGGGVFVLVALAWVHLGLGALLFPPAPTIANQRATAGAYRVTLGLVSGQFVTGAHNTVLVSLADRSGHAVEGARVWIEPQMTTMVMPVPKAVATAQGSGHYRAQPFFSMAGSWRLVVHISVADQPDVSTAFLVGVRWS